MIINMAGGGGGLKDTNAVLIVNIPTGSNVTAEKGVLAITPTIWTKSSDSRIDCAIFNILSSQFDSINPWIITATKGTETVSLEILVTTNKEYELTLNYGYIYDRGEINPMAGDLVSGWNAGATPTRTKLPDSYYMKGTGTGSAGANGTTVTSNLINVTEYNTLCIVFSAFSTSGSTLSNIYFGLTSDRSSLFPDSMRWSGRPTPNEVISLDISSISGNYYIGFGGTAGVNVTWEFNVIELWLE